MSLNNNEHVVVAEAAPFVQSVRLVAVEAGASYVFPEQSFDYMDDIDELVWRRGGVLGGLVVS